MNQSTAKKFGFWSALAMVIGSVVGIGIFFKNKSVYAATDSNGVATLLAWIFGGLISLMCALSFAEISKSSTKTNGGLGEYSKTFVGKRFSNFVKTNYTFIYFGILAPALAYFTYIFLTAALNGGEPNPTLMGMFITLIVGPLLSLAVVLFFPGLLKGTMTTSVVVKFLPLLLAALSGIWFTKNGGGIKFGATPAIANANKSNTFTGMLAAMPMILFAYDAFINVGSIAKDTKNADKNIPLSIGVGMVSVTLLYTTITIAQLMQNRPGSVAGSIASAISSNSLSAVISFIIVISACGTTLSLFTAGTSITGDLIESDTMALSKSFSKKFKSLEQASAALFALISLGFGLLFFIIQVSVGGGDMLDSMSNYPSLFFYVIYAIVMIGFTIDKIKKSNGKKMGYNIYLIIISIISALGISLIIGYQFYALIDSMVDNGFASDKDALINNVSLILYTVMFLTIPFINAFIKNKFEHKLGIKDALYNTMLVDLEGKKILRGETKPKKVKTLKAPKPLKAKSVKAPKPMKSKSKKSK